MVYFVVEAPGPILKIRKVHFSRLNMEINRKIAPDRGLFR